MPFTGANIATAYGPTANYWKLGQLYIDYATNTGFVNYLGYESESKAFSQKTPVKTLEIRLGAADITGIFGSANATTAGASGGLSVTGASIISFYDKVISSPSKATILQGVSLIEYPAVPYQGDGLGGGLQPSGGG